MYNLHNGLTPQEKLKKAKIHLLMVSSVFLSTFTFNLRHIVETSPAGTAHTDGFKVVYDPKFLETLSVPEITGLMAHEVWHVVFNHITRRGTREKKYYFAAADYVINLILTNAGFTLPKGGLIDKRFARMSTEEVYEILKSENTKVPEECISHVVESDATLDEDNEKESNQGNGSVNDVEDHIRSLLIRSSNQAAVGEEYGDIPGEVLREIKRLTNPVVPWSQLMMNFLTEKTNNDYSWRRLNRKLFPTYLLPGIYSEALTNITVAIDTSGSIDEETLSKILSEITYIHESMQPESMTIIDCDSRIHEVYDVDQFTDIDTLKFSGGGGTNFKPVFDYCEKEIPTVLIYFTDLYATSIIKNPNYPVLWICYSDHKPAEIGETIYVNYYEK